MTGTDRIPLRAWRAAVFVLPLAVYAWRLPPSVSWVDSGLLCGAVAALGLPHPPGFPSYLLAGHLFTRLPFSEPAYALSLFSSIFGAGCAWLVFEIARLWLAAWGQSRPAVAASGALCYAFSYGAWSQAATAEQFTFTAFFVLGALWLAFRLEARLAALQLGQPWPKDARRTLAALCACAVAAGGSHPIAACVLPALAVLAYARRSALAGGRAALWTSLAASAAAFVGLYALLALAGRRDATLALADPGRLSGLLHHVGSYSLAFSGQFGEVAMPSGFSGAARRLFEHTAGSFTLPVFALSLLGAAAHAARDPIRFATAVCIPAGVWTLNAWQLTANQEATFLPAQAVAGAWISCAAAEGLRRIADGPLAQLSRRAAPLLPALALLPLLACVAVLDRRGHDFHVAYARKLLESLPPRAVLVSVSDVPGVYYLQVARGLRPDVALVRGMSVAASPWARQVLRARHGDLDFSGLERALDGNPVDAPGAVAAFVRDNYARRPLHLTVDVPTLLPPLPPLSLHARGLTLAVSDRTFPYEPATDLVARSRKLAAERPFYRELTARMWWVSLRQLHAQACENTRLAAHAARDAAREQEAGAARDALTAACSRDLELLSASFPARLSSGPLPAFGVQPRPR